MKKSIGRKMDGLEKSVHGSRTDLEKIIRLAQIFYLPNTEMNVIIRNSEKKKSEK